MPGPAWKLQVVHHGNSRSPVLRQKKLPFAKGPPMPRWLRRPFVASRSLGWGLVPSLQCRLVAGWLAGVEKRGDGAAERRAHDPNNPTKSNPTQVQRAMHRAVASCRVARRTGALAASARREARARNSGTPRRRAEERRPATGDRQTTRGDRRGETNVPRRSRRPSRPGIAASHPTGRGAAWRVGAAGAARACCGRRARPREIAELRSGGSRRGRCPFAAATATQVQRRRAARARRAPLAGLWCGELQMLPPGTLQLNCGRVVEFWICQHRHIQKQRRRAERGASLYEVWRQRPTKRI